MSDLSERIAWILENRRRPDGSTWSASALSNAAGLPSRASAVSRALWDVARVLPGVTPEDYDAARAVASDSAQFMDHDGDVAGFAESLLRAAASLQRDGIPASTAAVLTRVAVGRVHGAEARDAVPAEAVVEHLEERARASGLEPGEKREHGKRIGEEIARKRGRTPGN